MVKTYVRRTTALAAARREWVALAITAAGRTFVSTDPVACGRDEGRLGHLRVLKSNVKIASLKTRVALEGKATAPLHSRLRSEPRASAIGTLTFEARRGGRNNNCYRVVVSIS
jgi:hypothetical protein